MSGVEDLVLQLVGSPWAFVVIGVVLTLGSVAVFLPSQAMVVAFGTLLLGQATGLGSTAVLVLTAAAGMVLGDVALYLLAQRADLASRSWFARPKVRKAREAIDDRYRAAPARIAVLGRFIPLGRLTTNLVGADSGLSLRKFVLACVVADLVWSAYCVGIAAATGPWARQYPIVVTAIAVVASILLGLGIQAIETVVRRRRGGPSAAEHSTPAVTGSVPADA